MSDLMNLHGGSTVAGCCTTGACGHADGAGEMARLRAEVKRLMDGMELAWGLVANGQYWDRTDGRRYGEWNEARAEWRDEHWHPALERNNEARRER